MTKKKQDTEADWIPLERMDTPLISDIPIDELTQALVEPFDYSAEHAELFYPYKLPMDFPTDFGVGIIVGASGTGKSTLLSQFGEPVFPKWEPDMTIASHFTDPTDAN